MVRTISVANQQLTQIKKKPKSYDLSFMSCGGRIRTCDLQVMSLASYQLLHSAMLLTMLFSKSAAKVRIFSEPCKFLCYFFGYFK